MLALIPLTELTRSYNAWSFEARLGVPLAAGDVLYVGTTAWGRVSAITDLHEDGPLRRTVYEATPVRRVELSVLAFHSGPAPTRWSRRRSPSPAPYSPTEVREALEAIDADRASPSAVGATLQEVMARWNLDWVTGWGGGAFLSLWEEGGSIFAVSAGSIEAWDERWDRVGGVWRRAAYPDDEPIDDEDETLTDFVLDFLRFYALNVYRWGGPTDPAPFRPR